MIGYTTGMKICKAMLFAYLGYFYSKAGSVKLQ
jgi:hypothetical protein